MAEFHFPFSAVEGQGQFKLALILAAINPVIGGVVICGPRGCAKSTLARGLADLLPPHQVVDKSLHKRSQNSLDTPQEEPAAFVTLPLGASEEMLLGTLDLQQVLSEQKVAFCPGLLSKAHGGVLYVDEVNLLADNLVDLLLDVAASGINRVERDGISHSHKAEFLLVGTMNPDEGELRPQLHDRFGFSVELTNQYAIAERVAIVRSREAFDRDPQGFCQQYAAQQAELLASIQSARQQLHSISCDDSLRVEIAERCSAAQVDGMRADIVWYRAALAHAAWSKRQQVCLQDIDAVEELVLAHRRKQSTPPDSQRQSPPSSQPPTPPMPPSSGGFKRPDDSSRQQQNSADNAAGDWGSMSPQQQKTADTATLKFQPQTQKAQDLAESLLVSKQLTGKDAGGKQKGDAAAGYHRAVEKSNKPNWFTTLVANSGLWPPKELRFHPAKRSQPVLHLVLLDTSSSILGQGPVSTAKAVLLKIAEQAYLQREQLAVFGFGNNQVDNLLPQVRAPKELRDWLDALPAGGGTPMRAALEKASNYLKNALRRSAGLSIHTYILTDGRSSAQLNDIQLPGTTVLIDTEVSSVKRGRGKDLAAQLGADYFPLPI